MVSEHWSTKHCVSLSPELLNTPSPNLSACIDPFFISRRGLPAHSGLPAEDSSADPPGRQLHSVGGKKANQSPLRTVLIYKTEPSP